ncbi:hypothetical protein NQZ68_002859 [Dissostichus eleginoides]|nr:hypothetical protein NQZ68_002859 [Dissostichus eleginoides]
MKDRVSRSPPLPHVAAHDQWCSALALVCSAPLSPLRGVVRLAGVAACAHVSLPPLIAHHSDLVGTKTCTVPELEDRS